MIQVDGKTYHHYTLVRDDGSLISGYDTRSYEDVTKAWIDAWGSTAKKRVEHEQACSHAQIANEHIANSVDKYDEDPTTKAFAKKLVSTPPCFPSRDEFLILEGVPTPNGKRGFAMVVANSISGISDADEESLATDFGPTKKCAHVESGPRA